MTRKNNIVTRWFNSSHSNSKPENSLIADLQALEMRAPASLQKDFQSLKKLLEIKSTFVEKESVEPLPKSFKILFWTIYATSNHKIPTRLLTNLLNCYHAINPSLLADALKVGIGQNETSQFAALNYALSLVDPEVIDIVLSNCDRVTVDKNERADKDTLTENANGDPGMKVSTPTSLEALDKYFFDIEEQDKARSDSKNTCQFTLAHQAISSENCRLIKDRITHKDRKNAVHLIRQSENPAATLMTHGVFFLENAANNHDIEMLSELSGLYLEYTNIDTWQTMFSKAKIDLQVIVNMPVTEEKQPDLTQQQQETPKDEKQQMIERKKILAFNDHWLLFSQIKMGNNVCVSKLIAEYKKLGLGNDFLKTALRNHQYQALALAIQTKNYELIFTVMAAYNYVEFKQNEPRFFSYALSELTLANLKSVLDSDIGNINLSQQQIAALRCVHAATLSAVVVNEDNTVIILNALCANHHMVLKDVIENNEGKNIPGILNTYYSVINNLYRRRIQETLSNNNFETVKSLLLAIRNNSQISAENKSYFYQFIISVVPATRNDLKLLQKETGSYKDFQRVFFSMHPELQVVSRNGMFSELPRINLRSNMAHVAVGVAGVAVGVTLKMIF